ncbi:HlyD family secretion protein [Brenneria tiliae]|uniref:HlyD family secretion protein n=1 Tax=Brenneria tiliae TaxID=2914984 RepID=UPI00201487DE|nr:HlyD family secretion protein [Brenneria tiliae]MCL2898428.1 efflux RND transporter periplasmic adaptor subunit [Brenneria tiliae]MCL2903030.1 efflux RND transporter periplasmic adaptor subunit [Brenneria tiliae]
MSENSKPRQPTTDDANSSPVRQPEDKGLPGSGEQDPKPSEQQSPPSLRLAVAIGVLSVIAVLLVLFAWRLPPFSSPFERTENAYVRGQVTTISPQVNGYVADVLVGDFQNVDAGQALFRIDDRIYRQRLEQARAGLASSEADLANSTQAQASSRATVGSREAELASARAQRVRAEADMARVAELAADGSLSIRERDEAEAALRAARATVKQSEAALEVARQDVRSVEVSRLGLEAAVASARAAVRLAEIDLDNTVITAPEAGQLGQVGTRRGQYVSAGTQLVSLVPPRLWIIANFKERQAGLMQEGQSAIVTVDALDDRRFTGRLQHISPATGSEFALLPAQNATGNFTKVAQRLPVRIVLDADQEGLRQLRPGMSVVARVDTSNSGREKQ